MRQRRRRTQITKNSDAWLLTYSDVVTLLMAFFVILLSISTIDQSKVEKMQSGLSEDLYKKKYNLPFSRMKDKMNSIVIEKKMTDYVEVIADELGLQLKFNSTVLFQSGSADIKGALRPVLNEISEAIKDSEYKDYIVKIDGHTDDNPIKTLQYPSNWELSAARATRVVRFMINRGIPKRKLTAAGYSDSQPLLPNRDTQGGAIRKNQAANRRIVVNIHRAKP
ncbi:MAG: chemotaxis protein MotB [Candidatus Marinamargulisbacteria bacterium]|jgi:chemotaxis protein MotB